MKTSRPEFLKSLVTKAEIILILSLPTKNVSVTNLITKERDKSDSDDKITQLHNCKSEQVWRTNNEISLREVKLTGFLFLPNKLCLCVEIVFVYNFQLDLF